MTEQVGSAQSTESSASGNEQDDKVAYATYKRVLSEAKKYKELAETLSKQTEKERENKLKEQNEWKTIAELNQQKLDQAQKELEEKNRAIQDGLKYSEFQRHLGGKLRHDSYVNHIDFEKIAINPETGRVDENSVKSVVSEFVKVHSHLVDYGNKPRLPNQAPSQGTIPEKRPDEMTKAELEQHILNLAKIGKIK